MSDKTIIQEIREASIIYSEDECKVANYAGAKQYATKDFREGAEWLLKRLFDGIPDPAKWVDEAKTIIDYLKIVEQNLRDSHAAYLLKTQEHDIAQCRLVEEIEQSEALQQQLATVTQQRDEAVKALNMLLNPDPQHQSSGCPMCDSGVLRNPLKEHWDDCNWNNAKKTLASLTPMSKEGDKIDTKTGYVEATTTVEPTDKQPPLQGEELIVCDPEFCGGMPHVVSETTQRRFTIYRVRGHVDSTSIKETMFRCDLTEPQVRAAINYKEKQQTL